MKIGLHKFKDGIGGRYLNAALIVASLAVAIGMTEGLLRLYFEERLLIHEEERSLLYRYDSRLGWFPRENSTHTFTGSRTISVIHNSRGFRDEEPHPGQRPSIMVLGDSFVWGYDVEAQERFTEKLRIRLPEWDIYNLGVSGYSTDQELLLLMEQYEYYRPRIVLLVFCTYNDEMENSANNIGQGAYYKPYYDMDQNMKLVGIPVPKSLSYFGRQHPVLASSYMVRLIVQALAPPLVTVTNPTKAIIHRAKEYIEQRGGVLVIGMVEPHGFLQQYLSADGISYVQLSAAGRYSSNGWHWTPEGHATVSNSIYNHLQKQGLLKITVKQER